MQFNVLSDMKLLSVDHKKRANVGKENKPLFEQKKKTDICCFSTLVFNLRSILWPCGCSLRANTCVMGTPLYLIDQRGWSSQECLCSIIMRLFSHLYESKRLHKQHSCISISVWLCRTWAGVTERTRFVCISRSVVNQRKTCCGKNR